MRTIKTRATALLMLVGTLLATTLVVAEPADAAADIAVYTAKSQTTCYILADGTTMKASLDASLSQVRPGVADYVKFNYAVQSKNLFGFWATGIRLERKVTMPVTATASHTPITVSSKGSSTVRILVSVDAYQERRGFDKHLSESDMTVSCSKTKVR